jgi:hypothetical protein
VETYSLAVLIFAQEHNLCKQFCVPVTIMIFRNEFVVGDKQIRMDIVHSSGQFDPSPRQEAGSTEKRSSAGSSPILNAMVTTQPWPSYCES